MFCSLYMVSPGSRAIASGGPVVPGSPIWNLFRPISRLGPLVAVYIQYSIFKMWPPFLFLAPPAAISWWRACQAVLLAGSGIVTTATSKAYNECKTLVQMDWSLFKCSNTNVVFHIAIFLILVVRNKERSSQCRNEGGKRGQLSPGAALLRCQIEVGILRTIYEMSNVSGC